MKHVDEETRRQVRNARLDALEADNYVEPTDEGDDADLYMDDDPDTKKKKSTKIFKSKSTSKTNKSPYGRQRIERKMKSLAQLIFEEV
jgi:zinc finger HIT domain-containing protein 1